MVPVSRVGDLTLGMGRIMVGAPTVFVNSRPVGLVPSPITPHLIGPKHHLAFTATGCPSVFANYLPIAKVGSITTCLHPVITGSLNVFCG